MDRLLRKLGTHRRLLVIGAHPDDEDTELLALVSQGMGGEAAYLSLSRGEGGQNLVGPDLGVGLGLVRSQELGAARRLDGGRQFFTRAYDFGFTRSLDEAFRYWPREVLLEDAVRIVRRFRPQVVVSVFSGTPRDGHGQHQAAGVTAQDAYRAAGDAKSLPALSSEGLTPWQPLALYRSVYFDPKDATIVLPTGGVDPLTGRSYYQIAMASRSLHRSQDMGRLQEPGPNETRVSWIDGGKGRDGGDLFAGVDTRLRAIAGEVPEAAAPRGHGKAARPRRGPDARSAPEALDARPRRHGPRPRRGADGAARGPRPRAAGRRRRADAARREDRAGRGRARRRRRDHARRHGRARGHGSRGIHGDHRERLERRRTAAGRRERRAREPGRLGRRAGRRRAHRRSRCARGVQDLRERPRRRRPDAALLSRPPPARRSLRLERRARLRARRALPARAAARARRPARRGCSRRPGAQCVLPFPGRGDRRDPPPRSHGAGARRRRPAGPARVAAVAEGKAARDHADVQRGRAPQGNAHGEASFRLAGPAGAELHAGQTRRAAVLRRADRAARPAGGGPGSGRRRGGARRRTDHGPRHPPDRLRLHPAHADAAPDRRDHRGGRHPAAAAVARRLHPRRGRSGSRSAAGHRRSGRDPDRARPRRRRPLALRRDPRRQPRLRDRPGAAPRERPAARLRPRGRTRHRAVPAVRVPAGRLCAVHDGDLAPARPRHRRGRAR